MKKKLTSLALAVLMLTLPAAAFSDVDSEQYYAAPVAWAVGQGITTGTTESTFSPDGICTRGQILTFLWRSAGAPEPQTTVSPFSDVTPDLNPDFYKAILWAYETGVIGNAAGEGRFSPNSPCTRSLTMSFLWRYAGSPLPRLPAAFEDVDPQADYAMAVSWAVETGVTGGVTENQFQPDAPCTRGQIVTFLYRSLGGAVPELPVETGTEPQPSILPETPPLLTLSGSGSAYSLGLDGSAFNSAEVYRSEVQVAVYSEREAVLTVSVPFPLYQAWDYAVRFTGREETDSPAAYVLSYARWDEAFADMVPSWQDGESTFRLTELAGEGKTYVLEDVSVEEDRMGGKTSWRVLLPEETPFRFTDGDQYTLTCEVTSGFGV